MNERDVVILELAGNLLVEILASLRQNGANGLAEQLERARVQNDRADQIWTSLHDETKPLT